MSSHHDTFPRINLRSPSVASIPDAIEDLNAVSVLLDEATPLSMYAIHERILDVDGMAFHPLSNTLKFLISTNGSITQALQALQPSVDEKVKIKSINQVIIGLSGETVNPRICTSLAIPADASFNFRKVVLCNKDTNYIFAISLTPLCRLSRAFQDDLMRADVPIGFLLEKYKLQVLRHMRKIDNIIAREGISDLFHVPEGTPVPFRIYDIEHKGELLMKIIEFFNPLLC